MIVNIAFDHNVDIIEVPDDIEDCLNIYQHLFLKWLYDKSINHSYWMYKDGVKFSVDYRANAFVEWLNTFIFDNGEARILKTASSDRDKSNPIVYF